MSLKRLDVKGAADFLGVSKDTIYNMVQENQLPHFRLRRRIMFSQETLEAWIKEQERKYLDDQQAL